MGQTAVLYQNRRSDAAAHGTGLVFVFAVLAAVVHPRLALVQHLIERVGMVLVLREAVDEADGHHVLAAVLQRVDAEHATDVLNVRFARETWPAGLP